MPADLKYLREHYASLSDDALLAIHREDLVETAQRCYDDEIKQRGLASGRRAKPKEELPVEEDEVVDREADPDQPDWLEDASEVYSRVVRTGNVQATDDLADARDVSGGRWNSMLFTTNRTAGRTNCLAGDHPVAAIGAGQPQPARHQRA